MQVATPRPPEEPKKPAAHEVHAVAGAIAYDPEGHSEQVDDVR